MILSPLYQLVDAIIDPPDAFEIKCLADSGSRSVGCQEVLESRKVLLNS
jgi:hypothetical protein